MSSRRAATPAVVASFRSQLTVGEDVVDPSTWAGSVPVAHGIAPRVRIGHGRWFNLLWLLPIGFVLLIVAVAAAKGLQWVSPRGPVSIDPKTRDIVQNEYIRKLERVGGVLKNVEFDTFKAVDPQAP